MSEATSITLDASQGKAKDEVVHWLMEWYADQSAGPEEELDPLGELRDRPLSVQQVFKLFGWAGTGKTTLAKDIAKACRETGLLSGPVLYAAFTGKAALVMSKKGCSPCSTIHSLIYHRLETPIYDEKTKELKGFDVQWQVNYEDSPLLKASLLIIDECSMVGGDLAKDLLSFGIPILVLGDPGQLPPVNGTGYFMTNPDVVLTEIHRQARDNPIIDIATRIRTGSGAPKGRYGESLVTSKSDIVHQRDFLEADQVLCGKNATRRQFNSMFRVFHRFTTPQLAQLSPPQVGEKLVCLKNDRLRGLLNGSLWTMSTPAVLDGESAEFKVTSLDFENREAVKVKVPMDFFRGKEDQIDYRVRRRQDEFDFGYVLTVHKSQGSQWDKVLIWNENYCFREYPRQWLYTAVTRAAKSIVLAL